MTLRIHGFPVGSSVLAAVDFLVRVTCPCGASRHIEPEALARIAARSVTLAKLAARMRCSRCGKKAGGWWL